VLICWLACLLICSHATLPLNNTAPTYKQHPTTAAFDSQSSVFLHTLLSLAAHLKGVSAMLAAVAAGGRFGYSARVSSPLLTAIVLQGNTSEVETVSVWR
jgi:hypothetical protein